MLDIHQVVGGGDDVASTTSLPPRLPTGTCFIKLIDVDTVRIFWALISPLGYAASGSVWASNGLLQHERDVVPRHGAAPVPAG